jgi:hypothetical protein
MVVYFLSVRAQIHQSLIAQQKPLGEATDDAVSKAYPQSADSLAGGVVCYAMLS